MAELDWKAKMLAEQKALIARYTRENESVVPGQIVMAGSSLMEHFPINKLLEEQGETLTVYNRGIGGYTTGQYLEVLELCVLDLKPRRVFINIGTNDFNGPDSDMDGIMARYDAILTRIRETLPQVELYLMAYYPVNPDAIAEYMKEVLKFRTNELLRRANRRVAALAEKHGGRFINVNDPITDEEGRLKAEYTVEGMHITEDGYRAVLTRLLPYLKA